RTLWVDAICINQADNEGKECEVARMCSIYFNCRQSNPCPKARSKEYLEAER
ncbi:uncharacterized protein K441DRAFT_572108, partial [Cenococcum geophilum 1.58]|uniref:uncharacterized protein n=1 Tax=Cenococcum geophilum 1.58 TaxID=794803 RepID=UPI00358F93EC